MTARLPLIAALAVTALAGAALTLRAGGIAPARAADPATCSNDAGLSLPPGFCATIFADKIGPGRGMAIGPDGTLYVNTLSSLVIQNKPDPKLGYLVALRDSDGDGKADVIERFGPTPDDKSIGGTGVAIWRGGLFVEQDDRIVRYALTPGKAAPAGAGETIVSGLPLAGDHGMKPILIDPAGNLFVNSGSASNVCETVNRQPGAKGKDPCDELPTRAGIWKYRADRTGQIFSPAERHATGIRNTGGLALDAAGRLFAMQHGRDQLAQNWSGLYSVQQGAELPAEELIEVKAGDDFGWPYCYYDGARKLRVLAPEYGGDGGKAIGRCATTKGALVAFPAHWAPTGLGFYAGGGFPAGYKGGLFVSFHGSWNRAPAPQDGFRVVFQPMANGRPSGAAILFADGFAGPNKGLGRPANRPTGLLATPDAVYVSDDAGGRIWKIVYRGPAGAPLVGAKLAPVNAAANPAAAVGKLPEGFTSEQVALGDRIYRGIERAGTCQGCHGPAGAGTAVGPALAGPDFLWGDGSVASIAKTIKDGVSIPKKFPSGMPALGGSPLSDSDVAALSAYLWTLSHK
jgi:glucose/arabinose dehydrogenase